MGCPSRSMAWTWRERQGGRSLLVPPSGMGGILGLLCRNVEVLLKVEMRLN